MEIHYSKHHAAYVANLNKALESHPEFSDKSLDQLLTEYETLPQEIQTIVRNNAGGHFNHTLFWELLTPQKGLLPSSELLTKINESFGSIDAFKEEFTKAAMGRFGSGWAWVIVNTETGKLEITSTPNQDTPAMQGKKCILALDVWEHAYYLKYQNKRAEYIQNWWNIVNWEKVSQLLSQ